MKVAVSTNGKNLDATIHDRFGRCPFYLLIETDDMHVEVVENTNAELLTSAGIQSAGLLASKGVEAVITGNCGPKAMQVFDAAAIPVILDQHGGVKDAVDAFKRGALKPAGPTDRGLAAGDASRRFPAEVDRPGGGLGRGMGRGGCGRGMGGGRGMGRRCAPSVGSAASGRPAMPAEPSREDRLARLRREADALKRPSTGRPTNSWMSPGRPFWKKSAVFRMTIGTAPTWRPSPFRRR